MTIKRPLVLLALLALALAIPASNTLLADGAAETAVCHNGRTVLVSSQGAAQGHTRHGDDACACEDLGPSAECLANSCNAECSGEPPCSQVGCVIDCVLAGGYTNGECASDTCPTD